MTRILIVFDRQVDLAQFPAPGVADGYEGIDLFPLTARTDLIEAVKAKCLMEAGGSKQVTVLDSARYINAEVDALKERVAEWSADLGDRKVGGKTIKQWLLTSQKEVSTWWFNLLSEKNTLKTDVFFQIAQLQALEKRFRSNRISGSIIATQSMRFNAVYQALGRRHSKRVACIVFRKDSPRSWKERTAEVLLRLGCLGDVFDALGYWFRTIIRGGSARRKMGNVSHRRLPDDSLLFVSYFPAVDATAAESGIFVNKYAEPLQEAMKRLNIPVSWLLMYVRIGGYSYQNALNVGRSIGKSGEPIFFIEEFFTPRVSLAVLLEWIRQCFTYFSVGWRSDGNLLSDGLGAAEISDLLYPVWRKSIIGRTGMEGLIHFEIFKNALSHFPTASRCLYYLEMHAWEKALNAARRASSPKLKTIGFQHVPPASNYFHFYHHPNEMAPVDAPTDLPLPDHIGCNGSIPCQLLSEQGYPDLELVEAVRQQYMADYLDDPEENPVKRRAALVAGSIDFEETSAILSLLHAAYPGDQAFDIRLKGHPATPMERVCNAIGIDLDRVGYDVRNQPIDELLSDTAVVVVGSSTVAIEALALGCEVIVPVIAEQMLMSPLVGFESRYHQIFNAESLREIMDQLIRGEGLKNRHHKDFLASYWLIDEALTRWVNLLRAR